MNQNIIEKFNDLLGEEKVKVDEPMKRHTTFRIGGPADYFLLPRGITMKYKHLAMIMG